MNRPGWPYYFLRIAQAVAERSDCRRSKVGAVIVDAGLRIVSTGYVGTAPGEPGCLAGVCPRGLRTTAEVPPGSAYNDCISFHAEVNALLYSDRTRHENGCIYVTREPCHWCYKLIKAAGIATVVYLQNNTPDGRQQLTHHDTITVPMRDWTAVSGGG
jgi:dCMP deaminase